MSSLIVSQESLTLDLPPSCIEFCPAHPEYFLVGTYNLEKDEERAAGDLSRPQNRNGSIIAFQLRDEKICHVQTVPQPSAVLDLHFQHAECRRDIFAVALSTGALAVYRLSASQQNDGVLESICLIRLPGVGESVLFLACVWHPNIPDLLAVSTSTGGVYIINLLQAGDPNEASAQPVLLHDLEAWTVAFQPFAYPYGEVETPSASGASGTRSVIIFSGGDDSTLRYTSYNVGTMAEGGTVGPVSANVCTLKGHGAGVTAILPLTIKISDGSNIVITGSYDDHIRVYSILSPLATGCACQARCLADKNLDGGVWRLVLLGQTILENGDGWKLSVLASCMHAGARIIRIRGDNAGNCQISVVSRFEEHQSMNYGSDFQPGPSLSCISTSFYDRLMCLWKARVE